MSERAPDISVVISTYNRCQILPRALEGVLNQNTSGISYEVIVVDNNSTDNTREVIRRFVAKSGGNLKYVFEGRQGLSHGWNCGIENSRASIISFTDDDLVVPDDWVVRIKEAFDSHPEVSFIGGRMMPIWPAPAPRWLTRELWSPLALQDETRSFYTDDATPVCLLNKSFRREAFDAVGGFVPGLGRVRDGVGSLEDDDLQRRLWKSGRRGMHVPEVVVDSPVDSDRMTKAYYRRWYSGHGRHYAMMRETGFEKSKARLFDVPLHVYRQASSAMLGWSMTMLSLNPDGAFAYEMKIRFALGFVRHRVKEMLTRERQFKARANGEIKSEDRGGIA